MKSILVLRSFGDYIIMLNCLKKKQSSKINVFASRHLESLHKSLNYPFEDNIRIEFIDFKINKGILPLFTNKYFFTISNINTLINLKKYLNAQKNINFIIEQDKRLRLFNLIMGRNCTYIHSSINNIYNSYSNFLNSKCDNEIVIQNFKKIIIFPDSRKKEKVIKDKYLDILLQKLNTKNVLVAKFDKMPDTNNTIYYNDFEKLVCLIKNADIIISSDSLPLHLCQFFNKFHFGLYNNQINDEWTTPISNNYNTNYVTSNIENLSKHINSYLC